jgi:hypothetical protein
VESTLQNAAQLLCHSYLNGWNIIVAMAFIGYLSHAKKNITHWQVRGLEGGCGKTVT